MTPQPSTSLRVRFAKAINWKPSMYRCNHVECEDCATALGGHETEPPTIDANTVREAMMGMTEEEWHKFLVELFAELDIYGKRGFIIGKAILQTPPTTLAELICEVRDV